MSIKSRPRQSISRRKPRAKSRELCLLVCEGKKDEPRYFDALKRELGLTKYELKIVRVGKDPGTVVRRAITEKAKAAISTIQVEYDKV